MTTTTDVLERGGSYFVDRSRVQREPGEVESIEDVQRMYVALHPEGKPRYRLIVVGHELRRAPPGRGRAARVATRR